MRKICALATILVLTAAAVAAQEKPVPLKDAAGRAVTENLCSGCHSPDYIRINAPFMNRQTWTAEVNKMIQAFGAPIQMGDANAIIEYLAANYGPPQ